MVSVSGKGKGVNEKKNVAKALRAKYFVALVY